MITNNSQMTGAIGESLVVAELIKKGFRLFSLLSVFVFLVGVKSKEFLIHHTSPLRPSATC